MKGVKKTLKNSLLVPVVAAVISIPGVSDASESVQFKLEVRSGKFIESMDLKRFVFLSTNEDFRCRYFGNLNRLSGEYYIEESVMEILKSIDLKTLEVVITGNEWNDLDGMVDGCHTKSIHTNDHTNVYGPGTYTNTHTDDHDNGTTCLEAFDYEKLLRDYSDVVNPGLVINSIINNSEKE